MILLLKSNSDDECPICLESYNKYIQFNCSHIVCFICYETMLKFKYNKHCPICRQEIYISINIIDIPTIQTIPNTNNEANIPNTNNEANIVLQYKSLFSIVIIIIITITTLLITIYSTP